MISAEQMRKLHAVARQAGEGHDHIRDRAVTLFGIESLKELTMAQARQLINQYQAEIAPKAPEPPAIPRFSFGSLPKRVAAKPSQEPPKFVKSPSADLGMPPVGKHFPNPASSKPAPAIKFARRLKSDPDVEKIPW